jgi:D-alanyl-D-alanine endopeptidase (penicillin-binding protein 7)
MNINYRKLIWLGALFLFMAPSVSRATELELTVPSFSETINITSSSELGNIPWEWEALSPAYSYSLENSEKYDPSKPMTIKINYAKANNYFKQIFILDELSGIWQPLASKDNPEKKYVTATTTSTLGKLIILSNPDILSVGTASWYKYKNGNFAASPDFKKGSVLRVTNLANGKSVDVTINDFGPERAKHPDRVIDLDKVAFQKIASTRDGLIKIKIDPLKVITPTINKSQLQLTNVPTISASSAVIMKESDGSIIWGKNEDKVSPLASLTKLVAVRTFLDRRPSLDQVVTYKVQDENYNYLYCKPWESAKLTVKDGETLTIENLIYSALVGSANNAIESLVRVSGLSRNDFIKKMNENVKNWGATSTNFFEPTGLSPKNVSSPLDYAIITKEVFTNPLLKKISTVTSYTFKTINTKKQHKINNTSQLVRSSQYPIIGSKTGYLDEAGSCLMTRVKTPQGNLIVVNFGSTGSAASFWDNEQLIRYGVRQIKK